MQRILQNCLHINLTYSGFEVLFQNMFHAGGHKLGQRLSTPFQSIRLILWAMRFLHLPLSQNRSRKLGGNRLTLLWFVQYGWRSLGFQCCGNSHATFLSFCIRPQLCWCHPKVSHNLYWKPGPYNYSFGCYPGTVPPEGVFGTIGQASRGQQPEFNIFDIRVSLEGLELLVFSMGLNISFRYL
jgi:hypothetical protein